MPLRTLRWPLLALLLLACRQALALDIYLSAEQLDNMLQVSFPYSYQSGPYVVTLSNPKVKFYGKQHRVGLDAHMVVRSDQGEAFSGRGTVAGQLNYDQQSKQLQLVRPSLEDLDVAHVSPAFKPTLDQTKAMLKGQQMPLIVLVNLQQLSSFLPMQGITDVRVGEKAIIITL